MDATLDVPAAESVWVPGGRFGLLSGEEYLAVTRSLLNTIRQAAPRWIPADDARLWRTWIGLVESEDLEPERPVGPPRRVLMQLWASTHLALLAGSLRLPVPRGRGAPDRPGFGLRTDPGRPPDNPHTAYDSEKAVAPTRRASNTS